MKNGTSHRSGDGHLFSGPPLGPARRRRKLGAGLVVGVTLVAAVTAVAIAPASGAGAATYGVTTCAASGAGSLPQVIGRAVHGSTIVLADHCSGRSPIVLRRPIDIRTDLTIEGPGATAVVVSGGHGVRDFVVSAGVAATISGITVENGNSGHDVSGGGGILNQGKLVVNGVTVADNASSTDGGGIVNDGTLIVTNSTVADNSAVSGGGLYNDGPATVTNSTLSHNAATGASTDGGDIFNDGAPLKIGATIVANSASSGTDCSGVAGSFTDLGYNLDDDGTCGFTAATDHGDTPAGLDPAGLENNGGPTETISPESGSAAIGAVRSSSLCASPDQRGVTRPMPCDIGAVELSLPLLAITSPDSATATAGSPFTFTVTTAGSPVPSITKSGKLPKHVTFTDNGDGTATIAGTPKTAGTYPITIRASLGSRRTKQGVTQAFTLTVDPAP